MAEGSTAVLVHSHMRRLMKEHPFLGLTGNIEPSGPYTLTHAAIELFESLSAEDILRILLTPHGSVAPKKVTNVVEQAQQGLSVSPYRLTLCAFVDICVSVACSMDRGLEIENDARMRVAAELSAAAEQDAIAPA